MVANNRHPRLVILALEHALSEYLAQEIQSLLGSTLDVVPLSSESTAPSGRIDLVLVADSIPPPQRALLVSTKVTSIAMRYTLSRTVWQTLSTTPSVSRTVTSSGFDAVRSACNSLGLTQVELIVDDDSPDYDVRTAMVSLGTLMELSWMFGRSERQFIGRACEYMNTAQCVAEDCVFLLIKEAELKERFEVALNSLKCTAFHFDEEGYIISANGHSDPILNNLSQDFLGLPIDEAPRDIGQILKIATRDNEKVVNLNGKKMIAHLETVEADVAHGGVVTLRYDTSAPETSSGHAQRKPDLYDTTDLIGKSTAISRVRSMVDRAAETDLPTLVTGETGTGKEIVAGALHSGSARCGGPFLTINCAAFTESLVESELFGYEPGTFTGASRKGKLGLFRRADGGTLVLDEIESLSLHAQASLLRVVENGGIVPVGGTDEVAVNVRIVALTNQPLDEMISNGTFRLDLFYRLAVVVINLPAIRHRTEDIPLLAQHFAEHYGAQLQPAFIEILKNYFWPGNVRELRHCIDYILLMGDGEQDRNSLPPQIQSFLYSESYHMTTGVPECRCRPARLGEHLSDELERVLLKVAEFSREGRAVGRRKLLHALRMESYFLSERQLRDDLRELCAQGYAARRTALSGVLVTQRGRDRISPVSG